MRTKFWRFAYDADRLETILNSETLPFPDLSRWPQAKNSSIDKVTEDLRVGDFILLANFDRNTEIGIARVIGKIMSKSPSIRMQWKKIIPSLSLTPDIQGGVNVWLTEGVFCFDAPPAKRYKLSAHTSKLFPENA